MAFNLENYECTPKDCGPSGLLGLSAIKTVRLPVL